jgi:hypothetical protein
MLDSANNISFFPLEHGYILLAISWNPDYFIKARNVPLTAEGNIDLDRSGSIGMSYNCTYSLMDENFNLLVPIDVFKSLGANVGLDLSLGDSRLGTLFTVVDYADCAEYRDFPKTAIINLAGKIIEPFSDEYRNIYLHLIGNTGFYYVLYDGGDDIRAVIMDGTGGITEQYDGYTDKDGNLSIRKEGDLDFFPGTHLVRFSEGEKYGLADRNGKVVLPAEYDSVYAKMERYSPNYDVSKFPILIVKKDGKEGFCDMTGKLIVPPVYDEVGIQCFESIYYESESRGSGSPSYGLETGFRDGVVVVRNGTGPETKYALYNIDGTVIAGIGRYHSILGYGDGVVAVIAEDPETLDAKSAETNLILLDTHGKELFRAAYRDTGKFNIGGLHVGEFKEGLARGYKGGRQVYVDKTGKIVLEFPGISNVGGVQALAPGFSDGVSMIAGAIHNNEHYDAFIDRSGKLLSPFDYRTWDRSLENGAVFAMKWEEESKAERPVLIRKLYGYTPSGATNADPGLAAKPTAANILVNGENVDFDAYNIAYGLDGNNYFKLRDIGQVFDFGVGWDSSRNTIVIDTGKGYTPE